MGGKRAPTADQRLWGAGGGGIRGGSRPRGPRRRTARRQRGPGFPGDQGISRPLAGLRPGGSRGRSPRPSRACHAVAYAATRGMGAKSSGRVATGPAGSGGLPPHLPLAHPGPGSRVGEDPSSRARPERRSLPMPSCLPPPPDSFRFSRSSTSGALEAEIGIVLACWGAVATDRAPNPRSVVHPTAAANRALRAVIGPAAVCVCRPAAPVPACTSLRSLPHPGSGTLVALRRPLAPPLDGTPPSAAHYVLGSRVAFHAIDATGVSGQGDGGMFGLSGSGAVGETRPEAAKDHLLQQFCVPLALRVQSKHVLPGAALSVVG